MELKSEKSIKEYLKTLSDDTIIKYYLDVEYSPFPILVIEEYTRRFKRKTKEEMVKDLKLQARLAHKKTQELGKMARNNKLVDEVTREKSEEVIKQAKRKGYKISERIIKKGSSIGSKLKSTTKSEVQKRMDARKSSKSTPYDQLQLLEKLGQLQKAGTITEKEFQDKKKKILSKI